MDFLRKNPEKLYSVMELMTAIKDRSFHSWPEEFTDQQCRVYGENWLYESLIRTLTSLYVHNKIDLTSVHHIYYYGIRIPAR